MQVSGNILTDFENHDLYIYLFIIFSLEQWPLESGNSVMKNEGPKELLGTKEKYFISEIFF